MQEDYRFLDQNGERIFAGLHHPRQPGTRAVVLCHPLAEEKLWSHRVLVSFARDLAEAGLAVLRFDFRGEGDSDRNFEEADLESRVQDACFAVEAARAMFPSVTDVALVGLRLGAAIALTAATRIENVPRVVLWDPVVDGRQYMQAVLRSNLMYQMSVHRRVTEDREALISRLTNGETVNIEGYELARPLFEQVSDLQLGDQLSRYSGDSLIVQISQDEAPVRSELAALSEGHTRCTVLAVRDQPFWREIRAFCHRSEALTRVTLPWLLQRQ